MKNELTEKQKHFIRKRAGLQSSESIAKALKSDVRQVTDYIEILGKTDCRKQRAFTWIARSLPVLFIIFLEFLLRLFHYGGDLRLFVPMKDDMASYFQISPKVGRRYFFMQKTLPSPGRDLFLKKKPENGFRIFVLGGSTAAGYPYGNNVMFSRILNRRLSDMFPDRTVEVVNVAMSAINSYTLLDFTDEIIARKPDLILFYAGHNEYYGAMGAGSMESLGKNPGLVRFYLKLSRFRLFLLVRNITGGIRKSLMHASASEEIDPSATLMARIVANREIPYGSGLYRLGLRQFEENLELMLKKYKDAGVPVILSELISNLRDQPPFVSVKYGSYPAANDRFAQGRKLEQEKRYTEARIFYTEAKDLDALRFRAPEAINQAVHQLAARYGASVVPMRTIFEAASPNGLVGNTLMTDHLHPNINGYFLMADAFFETMRMEEFIASRWDLSRMIPSKTYQENWGITALDSAEAALGIAYLKGGWPFKKDGEANLTLKNYRPSTMAETLAVQILLDPDLNLEQGHVMLAQHYISRKLYKKAFLEYRALYTMVPHEMEFYEKAAELCILENQYAIARAILHRSLNIRETPFNVKWIGQILLMENKTDRALLFLEKAHRMAPKDTQVLFNLGKTHILMQNREGAINVFRQIKTIDPDSRYAAVLQAMLQGAPGPAP
jgi:tetratricopeptide (TPR) repeat protein